MREPALYFFGRNASISFLTLTLGACAVMPQPISKVEQGSIAATDRSAAAVNVEPLTTRLTLAEALARALKYNLDHRTRMMEQALAVGQLDMSRYDMLPKLTAAAGYNWRDKERITSSQDSVTGAPSLAHPYISSAREHTTTDLGLTWNALDFGVSYLSSKQNADRVLVAAEHRRKAMHLLMQDVRTAYWRAVCADMIEKELNESIRLGESALADSRKVEAEKVRDPLEALRFQRVVLENLRVLESIQRELAASRIELAALINLPPGANYQLADPLAADLHPPRAELPIDRMEELAVANNADLKEQFYNARIAVAETKKSMLRMFPSLSFNYTHKNDSDSYLINKNWNEAGAQISWNILGLLALPSVMRYSEANEKLAAQRRMTTQMAVLAQVHLSRQQYDSAYLLFERADAIWRVDQRIFEHTANREVAEVKGQLDRIANNTSAIVSLLRRFQALSQLYSSSSKVQATLGVEPAIGDLQDIKLSALMQQIEVSLQQGSWGDAAARNAVPVMAGKPQAVSAPVASQVAAQPVVPPALAPAIVAAETAVPSVPAEKMVVAAALATDAVLLPRFYVGKISLPSGMPEPDWKAVNRDDMTWVAGKPMCWPMDACC